MAGMTSSFKLLIFVWLISCVSLKLKLEKSIIVIVKKMTWEDSRQHCQRYFTDLLTVLPEDEPAIDAIMKKEHVSKAWVALKRDTANSRPWNWTDTSYNKDVIDIESDDCARVKTNEQTNLNSALCSQKSEFYCSPNNKFHKVHLSWNDAQNFCRQNHGELSTINTANIQDFESDNGWVGLHRDVDGIWRWTGEPSEFYDWEPGHPHIYDCGLYIEKTQDLISQPCDKPQPFLCYEETLIMVRENKTWEEALQHCRDLSDDSFTYDLLSSQYDHRYANQRVQMAVTNEVWIGLRFLAGEWKWTDGEKMEYQGLPLCAPQWKHCGTRNKNTTNLEPRDCMEKRNLICYKTKIT